MSGFLGRYEKRLDDKGRLSLPVPFRRAAADGPLVLLQYEAAALSLLPEAAWTKIEERLKDYRKSDHPGAEEYVRDLTSNSTWVTPDKLGRIRIPRWLQKAVSLNDDVLVVGYLDRIEVWNPELFEAHVAKTVADASAFKRKIFG